MTTSRIFSLLGVLGMVFVWFLVALNFDFPAPSITQGTDVILEGFLFGFMLIPKLLALSVIAGVNILV